MEVAVARLAVRLARHGHLPEDRPQRARVRVLDVAATDAVCPGHVLEPNLAIGAQIEVVLHQTPEQLSTVDLETCLQLRVRQLSCLGPVEPRDDPLELLPRTAEGGRRALQRVCSHGLLP